MGAMEKLTVSVPADMAASLHRSVADGEYASADEIVREALEVWAQSHHAEEEDVEWLREAVKAGEDSGPSIPAEEVYRRLDEIIANARQRA